MGVTPLTVRNWDKGGKLTAYRHPMNNYRLYKVEAVEELMQELEISKVAKRVPSLPPELVRHELARSKLARPELVEGVESAKLEKPKFKKLKIDVY